MIKLEEPDNGQAWVVAIAACIINLILSGVSRMVGLLYVAILDGYNVSRQEATLPFTVRSAIRCLAGPIVGIIGQSFGVRAVTFFGGVVASTGAALCYIAPNITWLTIFWGGILGFGFAFANTLFQVVVNQYFKKYRATASGIALSGACVGSFVFPFMIEAILDNFELSGTFLLLGGIMMNVLPPSLLMKAPPWVEDPAKYARLKALQMKQASAKTPDANEVPETPAEIHSSTDPRDVARTTFHSTSPTRNHFDVCTIPLNEESSTKNVTTVFTHDASTNGKGDMDVVCTLYQITESPLLYRRNPLTHGSEVTEINRATTKIPTICGDMDSKEKELKDTLPEEDEKNLATPERQATLWENILATLVLYKNPAYILICLCMAVYILIYLPILTVIVDYSKDKGIPETNGKHLINALSAGDLIGRLCFGWLTDKKIITIPVFMMLTSILQGLSTALFPFALSFYSFMSLLIVYGMMSGTIFIHIPLLVFKYVDHSQQSIAMGCVVFVSGFVSFGLPYFIGYFRDGIGSYDGMFYITGGISIVSGGVWLLEPVLQRIHTKNTDKKTIN